MISLMTPVTQTLPFTFSAVLDEELMLTMLAMVSDDEVTQRKHTHTRAREHTSTHTHTHMGCTGSRSLGNHAVHTQTTQRV